MLDKMKSMLEVKKLIALASEATFIYLAVTGKVSAEMFIAIHTTVIGTYFGNSIRREATTPKE